MVSAGMRFLSTSPAFYCRYESKGFMMLSKIKDKNEYLRHT